MMTVRCAGLAGQTQRLAPVTAQQPVHPAFTNTHRRRLRFPHARARRNAQIILAYWPIESFYERLSGNSSQTPCGNRNTRKSQAAHGNAKAELQTRQSGVTRPKGIVCFNIQAGQSRDTAWFRKPYDFRDEAWFRRRSFVPKRLASACYRRVTIFVTQ